MKNIFEYKKTGKTPAKEIKDDNWQEMIKKVMSYVDSIEAENCPIKCQYAKVLKEDVHIHGRVYEEGDILCGYGPLIGDMFCRLGYLNFKRNSLEGICTQFQSERKTIEIKP